jgi:hypothetical protein
MRSIALKFSSSVVVLAIVCTLAATAQNINVNDGNNTGFPVFGTFHGGNFDAVSLNNGNLHIAIPIASFPQRHGQFSYEFVYDTPSYTLTYFKDPAGVYWDANISDMELVGSTVGWRLSSPFGWNLSYAEHPISCTMACGLDTCQITNTMRTNYALFDPVGTKHPLALSYEVVPSNQIPCGSGVNQTTGLTLDGTGVWVQTTNAGRSAGQIILKDGTEVVNASWKDSNGNTALPSSDMLGRNNVVQSSGPNGSILYTITDSNGNPQTFRADYTSINVATSFCSLRSGLNGGSAPCSEYTSTWTVPTRLTGNRAWPSSPGPCRC